MTIIYQREDELNPQEFRDLLIRSTLGERRPIDDFPRIKQMCQQADFILTARVGELLIGVSRCISDFCYCTYLSDLAVDRAYQRQGIGKALVAQSQAVAPQANLILLAAPEAKTYYPKIGMEAFPDCFLIRS